jgi:uncharacterized protein YfaS (alpha-2-macroglobulin family)
MNLNSKRIAILMSAFVGVAASVYPARVEEPRQTEKDQIVIAPTGEVKQLSKENASVRVTFPTPMVDLEKVKRVGQQNPIVFDPFTQSSWIWVSQTEGAITFPERGVPHNVTYRAKLRPGLKDLAGHPVDVKNWGAEFAYDKFTLRTLRFLNAFIDQEDASSRETDDESSPQIEEERNQPQDAIDKAEQADNSEIEKGKLSWELVARPRVSLEFSRDVLPQDVQRSVYFQDKETHQRFPVEVRLDSHQSDGPQGWMIIEPIEPLPPGRAFLLVIDPLKERRNEESLPHLLVVPAGTTFPLTIHRISGLNQPLTGAFIRITTNHTIDPDPANLKLISVQPPVANFHIVPQEYTLDLKGDFNTGVEYRVIVKSGLKSTTAFDLEKDSTWKAHFHPKRPAIIFPQEEIFQRASAPTAKCSFIQVNTGPLEWKVAPIPRDKLLQVRNRLREFGTKISDKDDKPQHDPKTGEYVYPPTELFIQSLGLSPIASGTMESSGDDKETQREFQWNPETTEPGMFLVEVSGKDPQGRAVGNRSIISRSDWIVSEIDTPSGGIFRVMSMNNGKPVSGVPAELLRLGESVAGPVTTDVNGEAVFASSDVTSDGKEPDTILVGPPGHEYLEVISLPEFPSGRLPYDASENEKSNLMGAIVSDRNVYRPGEEVRLRGFVRESKHNKLSIPAGTTVAVRISNTLSDDDDEALYQKQAIVSATGGWESSWQIPLNAYGTYFISAGNAMTKITVDELRPPPFSVLVETEDVVGDTIHATIRSNHFHGAPNAGAKVRWKAEWLVDYPAQSDREAERLGLNWRNEMQFSDNYSPDTTAHTIPDENFSQKAGWDVEPKDLDVSTSATAEGETTLGADGTASLECKSPFPPNSNYVRAHVYWLVDVTSTAAQTLRGGSVAAVQFVPQILGVTLESGEGKEVILHVRSFGSKDESTAGLKVKAQLFRADTKTVKERLGSNVNRYRNFPTFQKIWEADLVTPATQTIRVPGAGNYIARITATAQLNTPAVSDATIVGGPEERGVYVENETSLLCKADKRLYNIGDTASIAVQSPFAGFATVTVESDRVLFRNVFEMNGNLQRITIPVLESFAPNAFVCVHVIEKVKPDSVPAERFGSCDIKVDQPGQRLQVTASLNADVLEPGANVSGVVKVSAQDKPVAGADVLLFAVNEASLALGRWKLPDFDAIFHPARPWQVVTHSALGKLWAPNKPSELSHSQKGFILGDAGPRAEEVAFRKDFKALAFWNASMHANSKGEVPFHFKAPEGLTSYRVVAVAQNGAEQFGNGHCELRLAKKLQVEPVLPDFLRMGDEVQLCTVVRQDYADSDDIEVTVFPGSTIQLNEAATKKVTAKRKAPLLVSFGAKVKDDVTQAQIGFAAKSTARSEVKDAEQRTFGIEPALLVRRKTVFGEIAPSQPLNITAAAPSQWLSAKGNCDVMLSGSFFLPKLAALSAMLEGQASFEKISTRILAATLLADTLQYVPLGGNIDNQLRNKVQDGLKRLASALPGNEGVPTWSAGGEPNDFITVQAAWAVLNARQRNFDVEEGLLRKAESWLDKMIAKEIGFDRTSADMRCFALMVRGSTRLEGSEERNFQQEAEQLFNKREELSDEGRAWLALGLHYLGILPEAQKTLLREIDHPGTTVEFDPATFSSNTRVEAIRLLAQSEIQSTNWSSAMRQRAQQSLKRITQSSIDPSTQENLWLLLVFNSLARAEIPSAMADRKLSPKPGAISKNRISVGWLGVPLGKLPETFAKPLQPGVKGSYLIRAAYQVPENETPPREPSLNLQRSVRNLTNASRTGSADAPFQLGDQVLVTYLLNADKPHSYVEVEDQLPACFETVNPKLPMIAEYFKLPIEAGVNTLPLSQVELRFSRTLLYFDKTLPGRNVYSVLARVTTPGAFHWPGTQVRPMYDSRFAGVSDSMIVHAEEGK